MFASLTVVGFFFALAWGQQIFLNRLIQDDLEHLKKIDYRALTDRTDS